MTIINKSLRPTTSALLILQVGFFLTSSPVIIIQTVQLPLNALQNFQNDNIQHNFQKIYISEILRLPLGLKQGFVVEKYDVSLITDELSHCLNLSFSSDKFDQILFSRRSLPSWGQLSWVRTKRKSLGMLKPCIRGRLRFFYC